MNAALLPLALLVGVCTAVATVVNGTLAIRFRSAQAPRPKLAIEP